MKFLKEKRAYLAAGLTSSLLALGLIFQNCSQVAFSPAPIDDPSQLDCGAGCPERGVAEMTAGAQNMPKLKLFFVVDNSFTMKANQVNLATSFEKMFDQANSQSLTPFDTTAFIINTSQYTYPFGNATLTAAGALLQSLSTFEALDLASISSIHRGALISGQIPGDELGYLPSIDAGLNRWSYSPATVAGFAAGTDGLVHAQLGVHKAAGEDPTSFKQDFQNRVAVLAPERNKYHFPVALDTEAGLCAMSRILRNNDNFVKQGELAAFVVVSDENDQDTEGLHCLNSMANVDDTVDLVHGWCETKKTTFTGQFVDPAKLATCNVKYSTGYDIKYTYTNPAVTITTINYRTLESETFSVPQVTISYYAGSTSYSAPNTKISFQKLSSQSYTIGQTNISFDVVTSESFTAPRSTVSYFKIATQAYKQTQISYYLRSECERDGYFDPSFCPSTPHTKNVSGAIATGTVCTTTAGQIAPGNVVLDGLKAPTCAPATPVATSCTYTDPNCITTFVQPNPTDTVFGTYASDTQACKDLATSRGGLVDASHPATCTATTALVGSGPCPANTPGCTSGKTWGNSTGLVDGTYADGSAECNSRVSKYITDKGLKGEVSAAHPAHCTAAANKTASGTCPANIAGGCTQNDTYTNSVVTVAGAYFAPTSTQTACDSKAKDNGATVDASHPAVCSNAGTFTTGSGGCPSNLVGCTSSTTYSQTWSGKIDGNFDKDQTKCNTAASALGLVDASHPATCLPAGSRTGSGGCSDALAKIGCTSTQTFGTSGDKNYDGDFSADGCLSKAKGLPKAAVSTTSDISKCSVGTESRSIPNNTLTVVFDSTVDPGTVAKVNDPCSDSVKAKIPQGAQSVTACTITAVRTGNESFTSYAPSCADKAASVCESSNGAKHVCTGTESAQGTSPYSWARNELLTCDDLCSKSITGACNMKAGVTVTPDMTIRQYLAAAFGSAMADQTCKATTVTLGSTRVEDQLNSQRDQICMPVNGIPTYFRQDGDLYHKRVMLTDFVSGTDKAADGSSAPHSNLPNYIKSRTAELFGEGLQPLVTTFVRRRALNDSLGNGGSYGDSYEVMADLMNGQKESVLSNDYSVALVNLGSVVKERLQRSFTINEMKSYQSVRMVWFRSGSGGSWRLLNAGEWSASGNTVTILPSLNFVPGNQFRFLYY